MADPQEFIDSIINNAIDTANQQTEEASAQAYALTRENAGLWVEPPKSELGFDVSAVEPDIPTVNDTTLSYEAQLDKLINLLSDQLAGFFSKYYPLASDAFDEATSWMVNVITNGGTGINANVEDQVWQRSRERVVAEGRRVEGQIVTGAAARGYAMPPGAMLKRIDEARFAQVNTNGEASTAIAAKQLEIEIETVRFAIGKAIDSRTMAMQAAADYIRAVASAPASAVRVAELNSDAKARMMSAASQWYGARLDRDKIVLSSKLSEMQARENVYIHRRTQATKNSQVDVQALSTAADVYARTASSALSSLNSIVSSATNAFS